MLRPLIYAFAFTVTAPVLAQDAAVPNAPQGPLVEQPLGTDPATAEGVQVGLPVDPSVDPAPIARPSPAEIGELQAFFSQTKGQFSQQDGAALYHTTCGACHMHDAKGAFGAGAYPPLAGNPKMISPYYIATVLLTGYHGMPRFGNTMDDAQIAAVTNYVRSHFGNDFPGVITAEEVGNLRAPGSGPQSE